MFQSEELKTYLETNNTVQTNALIFAEWNLNQPENIKRIGNYRYRPNDSTSNYYTIPLTYDPLDSGNYYTGATDSDAVVDGGVDENDDPVTFQTAKDKFKMLYSLEDCFLPFRPRSGINKPVYLGISGSSPTLAQYITNPSTYDDLGFDVVNEGYIVNRPRYYMSSRYDQFKYWTSFRTEGGVEYGVSQTPVNGRSYITDACPFVVYEAPLTPNRLIIKMQTNVGDINLGDMRLLETGTTIPDPLYGYSNQTTPTRWRVEGLKNNVWETLISFDELSLREDGTNIIGSDGYVELSYGLQIPNEYQDIFTYAGEIAPSALPTSAPDGYAYLIKESEYDKGIFAIYLSDEWRYFTPQYRWGLAESFISKQSHLITSLVDPEYFVENGAKTYREIDIIEGVRIVVDTMNKPNCTFDLIEISPRIAADLTDRVVDFSVTKTMSDLGNGKIPVGSLLAGTGSININNNDLAFSDNNAFDVITSVGSLVSNFLLTNVKFQFYEIFKNVDQYDYYVPIKTMYSEGFPQSQNNFDTISMNLRDAFFILESSPAPSLMLTDISLTNAITVLLDYIGFSNYVFRRVAGQNDPIIPYFFVAPNQNVAEVLNQLAQATQSAMFFDEYNNFVMMTKEYLLPDSGVRSTDMVLYGSESDGKLPNIIQISAANKSVNNSGQINYTKRYIQRSYGSTRQASYVDEFKTWVYVPTLLWEVTGDETTKSSNENTTQQSSYVLTAMPLKSDLTEVVPTVVNNKMTNNIIDVGESVYYVARYNGYFYANGEIIKYDAVEYSVTVGIWYPLKDDGTLDETQPIIVPQGRLAPANVPDDQVYNWRDTHRQGSSTIWINSADEYQKYFLQLPFNGKMYPTGNIRIWTEPEYVTVDGVTVMKNGAVKSHGRGQFGTPIASHKAGLDSHWSDNDNVYGCQQESEYLFSTSQVATYPVSVTNNTAGGVSPAKAKTSGRNGIIKNTLSQKYWTEKEVNEFRTANAGTIQSSALVFTGPNFEEAETPRDYVSYIHKPLNDAYKHFGTRMRIIGKTETGSNKVQTPIGSSPYFTINPATSDQQVNISGGSGGIGIMVDPATNNGYYFELVALTTDNVNGYYDSEKKTITSYNIPNGNVTLSGSGGRNVTIKTTVDHQFNVGDKVVVTGFYKGASISSINGEWTVTAKTTRSITYDTGTSNLTPDSGGVLEIYIETGVNISNIVFYKVMGDGTKAYPVKLWSGLGNVLVDSGRFAGQGRILAEENPTVYDLAVEYKDVGNSRIFYLYINDRQIANVVDASPLKKTSNVSLFVRGSSKCMFENVYALTENYSQNTVGTVVSNISEAFGDNEINTSEALRKYAVSGFVQAAYLNNISTYQPPEFNMYYDEFGTIMRECAHFNIKYDRAYPALYARLAPTLNRIKTYTSSGFYAGAYGADFLVFNCTDNKINLDATTGNFLRIQGVTFTQNTTKTLTVDDYFSKVSNLSDPQFDNSGSLLYSPLYEKELYNKLKISRQRHGNQEFSIESPYIQTDSTAEDVLGWIVKKTMDPKKNVGMMAFGTQILQLGDIVSINYKVNDVDVIAPETKQFVVYNIEYKKSSAGTDMTVYMAEV